MAGKSTLNRLELTPPGSPAAERYNKISYAPEAIDELLVTLFLECYRKAPRPIVLDLDATYTPLHGKQEAPQQTPGSVKSEKCNKSVHCFFWPLFH